MKFLSLSVLLASCSNVVMGDNNWNATLVAEGLKLLVTNADECNTTDTLVVGHLPTWLTGSYYTNGPGLFDVAKTGQYFNAVFDGYAILNKWKIDGAGNKATVTSRYVDDVRWRTLQKRGDMSYQGKIMHGTTPPRQENRLNVFNMGSEINVNFIALGKNGASHLKDISHLLAQGELSYGMEVDKQTIVAIQGNDTNGFFKYDDDLSALSVGCAHPVMLANGDWLTKLVVPGANVGLHTDYMLLRIAAGTSKRETVTVFTRLELSTTYAHSFALPSDRYVVLPFWPATMDKMKVAISEDLVNAMNWKPEDGTQMTVIDLLTGNATTFKCNDTFFGFHFLNAFVDESSGSTELVTDVIAFYDFSMFSHMMLDDFRNGSAVDHAVVTGPLKRLRIPLGAAMTQPFTTTKNYNTFNGQTFMEQVATPLATLSPIGDTEIETPRINPRFFQKPYKFVYGMHATRSNNVANSIAKIDVTTGEAVLWFDPDNLYGAHIGEPVFVPNPAAADDDEDNGVLVVQGTQYTSQKGFLVVLDAKTMTELARSYAPSHFTYGFHTQFYFD